MSRCGVCAGEGRHVHRCARCGGKLTMKASDWRVSRRVNADGSLAELRVEHSPAAGGCPEPHTGRR